MAALINVFFYSLAPRIVYLSLIFFLPEKVAGDKIADLDLET